MDIQSLEVLKIVLGSAGFLGIGTGVMVMVFRTGRIVQKIEDMGKKFGDLEQTVDKLEQKMDNRFREVNEQMDSRFREVNEQMDKRFREVNEQMDSRFREVNKQMDDRFREVNERFRKLEENLPIINIAITKLEVRLEERTLKMIDIPMPNGIQKTAADLSLSMNNKN